MKITVVKCPCGHKSCKDYHLEGFGKFVQGSGFTKLEALYLAFLLEKNKEVFTLIQANAELLTQGLEDRYIKSPKVEKEYPHK